MTDPLIERVLSTFDLNPKQRKVAEQRGCDVVATAGAGSGKTLTLVARYITRLAEGITPRQIAAITFTKKAAREMRSRVRRKLEDLQATAELSGDRLFWGNLAAQMDAARIGTIHSLCAELLRAHPAEAGIDPRFEVMDEGLSAALRIQAVDDTLKGLVEDPLFTPLLENVPVKLLTTMLQELLDRRLDAREVFSLNLDYQDNIVRELRQRMQHPEITGPIAELRSYSEHDLLADAGDKLAEMVRELLQLWTLAESALAEVDPGNAAVHLYQARRSYMQRRLGGKDSEVKGLIAEIQSAYDTWLNPLVGGKGSQDTPPSPEAEKRFEQLSPLLKAAFERVNQAYQDLLDLRQAVDFDDLEYLAQQLLKLPEIRQRWQGELQEVLVDEFQDTNQRQRDIIQALTALPGRLFIVGDMRQSIYRFRHADVTVFREEQQRIAHEHGMLQELDLTYRAHEPLLLATSDLLAAVIGTQQDPNRPYYVPFTSMEAHNKLPDEHIHSPHVEFVLGAGDDAEEGRVRTAKALAERLVQLQREGQIQSWDDVALLFRATGAYAVYEEALEDAGIPFVTVAGKGFYDRPEIRDLVNMLRALADPLDDLSFAGLLRSPAIGLSDAALFLLRQSGKPFWQALQEDSSDLSGNDLARAERAVGILKELIPLADRVPVAELIKQVIDALDYRAILATADQKTSQKASSKAGGRLWRNVDKLIEDAQTSQQVSVRAFLDMLKVMNDAGAREGEASAEALGAVRLMTIHRSKGLEFNLVVLADASRTARSPSEAVYLSNELGLTFKLDSQPLAYKLAKFQDADQSECEDLRILYVALTRAKQKLIISGHLTLGEKGNPSARGWTKDLLEPAGIVLDDLLQNNGTPYQAQTANSRPIRTCCLLQDLADAVPLETATQQPPAGNDLIPLYPPVVGEEPVEIVSDEEPLDPLDWMVTRRSDRVPASILGKIVHKALQRWVFPGDTGFEPLLQMAALNAGLATGEQRSHAIRQATGLLNRFKNHPLWGEIDGAVERYSEVPYSYQVNDRTENRFIDLLYRGGKGWQIVDFKTDRIREDLKKNDVLSGYTAQVQRYREAVKALLRVEAGVSICFLDVHGRVEVVKV